MSPLPFPMRMKKRGKYCILNWNTLQIGLFLAVAPSSVLTLATLRNFCSEVFKVLKKKDSVLSAVNQFFISSQKMFVHSKTKKL